MTRLGRIAPLLCVCLVTASPVSTNALLKMRASSYGPACLTVALTAEPDADNLALVVTAYTPNFYRSSQIELPGEHAPRTTVFELRVPTDTYEVTGILVGPKGPKARAIQMVRVLPLPTKSQIRCDAPPSR